MVTRPHGTSPIPSNPLLCPISNSHNVDKGLDFWMQFNVIHRTVYIENKLKWKDHIKAVVSTVTRAIAMIRYTKTFIPKHTLKMLYQGLVESHFRYCCSVWGTCGVTSRCNLEKLQNRVIRIITDSPYDSPAKPLLRQLRLPSIVEMIR